ncbi:MAG: glycosyltransferase [Proteobacteria bacterium]|nr:glycosyltransferase [Pseudomonadota bacterium]MDA1354893.1 glycosyltransferase [Pseudomonadota bacterium]
MTSRSGAEDGRLGVFAGPWHTGHVARDGAVLGFSDIERATRRIESQESDNAWRVTWLDVSEFLGGRIAKRLANLDVVYANCGPLAALLFGLREANGLNFRIVREVRTLGWVGYAFQEFIARELERPGDVCAHVSNYCRDVWAPLETARGALQHYPLLESSGQIDSGSGDAPGGNVRCGFFSRVTADKGFQFVPEIIRRMKAVGWEITSLDVCGSSTDGENFGKDASAAVEALGVAVNFYGELDYRRTMQILTSTDIVLFPSVSSIESLGRVTVEAASRGKIVIASDFCGAHDIFPPECLIPLVIDNIVSGPSSDSFAIGELDLERWTPPTPQVTLAARYDAYVSDSDKYLRILAPAGPASGRNVENPDAGAMIAMAFDWDQLAERSAQDWCAKIAIRLAAESRSRADLLDLGGAMKRSIVGEGFAPEVSFSASA